MAAVKSALGTLGRFAPYILTFFVGFAIAAGAGAYFFLSPVDINDSKDVSFIIDQGANWRTVSKDLEDKGLVRSWMAIYFPLRMRNLNPSIEPGEYIIKKSYTPTRIIEAIRKREIVTHSVTFPEGTLAKDYPAKLASTGLVTEAEVQAAMSDPELFGKFYIPVPNLEGYLFPSTYKFSRPVSAKMMLDYIIGQGVRLWNKERSEKAVTMGLSYHQVLTLASIIQKEAGSDEEMRLISSVIHNRLEVGMQLQCDSTVIYGIPDFNGNLTKKDLSTPSPYNTYVNMGLPPTPICNPGLAAIDAALNPEKSNYMFFVAKDPKSHYFSATLREHELAVQKYQKSKVQ